MAKRDHILSNEHSCCWREGMNDPDFFQNLASPDLKKSKFISCPHVKCMWNMVLLDKLCFFLWLIVCYLFLHIYWELSSSDLTHRQSSFVVLHNICCMARTRLFSPYYFHVHNYNLLYVEIMSISRSLWAGLQWECPTAVEQTGNSLPQQEFTDLQSSCTHRRPLPCQLLAAEKWYPGNSQLRSSIVYLNMIARSQRKGEK